MGERSARKTARVSARVLPEGTPGADAVLTRSGRPSSDSPSGSYVLYGHALQRVAPGGKCASQLHKLKVLSEVSSADVREVNYPGRAMA